MSGGWGSYSIRSCASIGSFKKARNYFEGKKPVKSKRWQANERPLRSSRETWYKMVRGGDEDYYDLVLFNTPRIRYYKPNEIGEEVVLLRNDIDRSTWMWLYLHGWGTWSEKKKTVGGEQVLAPLGVEDIYKPHGQVPPEWSARLVFTDGKLVLEKSDHRPIYKRKSSKEDKESRAKFRTEIDMLVELMTLRIDSLHENAQISWSRGRAFSQFDRAANKSRWGLAQALRTAGTELTDNIAEHLFPFVQELYNVSLSKRYYNDKVSKHWNESFSSDAFNTEGVKKLTVEQFAHTLRGALIHLSGKDRRTEKVALPKFPLEIPRRYFLS